MCVFKNRDFYIKQALEKVQYRLKQLPPNENTHKVSL